jgi:hypothetical protein
MAVAWKKRRTQVQATDVLEALMDLHDDACPLLENGDWTDARRYEETSLLVEGAGCRGAAFGLAGPRIRGYFSP